MPRKQDNESVPAKMRPIYDEIVELTDTFCKEHLTDEYAVLCRKMTVALCRKRHSPLESGRTKTWAAGIIYALGRTNFLFDKSQKPHMNASQLCELLDVSQNTASAKSKIILDLLDIIPLDPRWSLPSQLDENPMAWMLMVNGMIVDIRHMPREVQEIAFKQGLIPYIPADRNKSQDT